MKKLNDSQKKLYFLASEIDIDKFSLRELGKIIGGKHPQTVKNYLEKLFKDGFLVRTKKGYTVKEIKKENSFDSLIIKLEKEIKIIKKQIEFLKSYEQ